MNLLFERDLHISRRELFGKSATGIGVAAMASLLEQDGLAAVSDKPLAISGLPGLPHFAPKAKRVVVLWQGGAPSHVDLFQYQPGLEKMRMQQVPESIRSKGRLSTMTSGQKTYPVLPPIKPFKQYGKSGMWLSEMLPYTGAISDEICLINSMY